MDRNIYFISNKFKTVDHGPAKFAKKFAEFTRNLPNVLSVTTEKNTLSYVEHVSTKSLFFFKSIRDSYSYWCYLRKVTKPGDSIIFNTPYISTISLILLSKRRIYTFINDDNSVKISKNLDWYEKTRLLVFSVLDRLIVNRSSMVVVNSLYMESLFLKTFNIDSNKVFHLYKGLDLDEIAIHSKSKARSFSEECVKVLFVKSDYIRGGLPLLLEAINVLKKTKNIELSIVGPKDDSCLGRFKGSGFVRFLGKCDQNEVFKLMAESAIFCVPSYKEALGVANLEAMALGCLVVSTNTGGIPEVLNYGKAGRLIEPGNLEQLIKALEDSCHDSLANQELLRNAQHIISRFNVNTAIIKLLALVQENDCE